MEIRANGESRGVPLLDPEHSTLSVSHGKTATPLRACSACAGDYEDPERSAWGEQQDERDDQEDDGEAPARNDFPVREE